MAWETGKDMEKPLSGAGGMTHSLRALASLADGSRHTFTHACKTNEHTWAEME